MPLGKEVGGGITFEHKGLWEKQLVRDAVAWAGKTLVEPEAVCSGTLLFLVKGY